MLTSYIRKSHWVYLIIILLFSLFGMKALFHPGLFTAHDIWHQVVRLYYYHQAVNDGQIPPYWISQLANSFGYPLFFFSYHLPWIIGVILMKTALDISSAIKTLFFLSYISSGITMYFLVNNLLKNKLSALLSSILYLWLPYHFLIIFVSASMGIAFVFTFLPLVFLGIHLTGNEHKTGIPILSIGIAGIILSHIMHLVFLSPIILIFFIWEFLSLKKRINFLKNIALGLVVGILLSSFYLLPAIYYSQFTRVHQETGFYELYKRHFINFNQLIYSKWSFSPIVNNAKNGEISFQLGFAQWISIFTLAVLIIFKKLSKPYLTLSIYMLSAFIISVFLMLDFSKPIWGFLVKLIAVDFPFRLILPAAFIASICAGIILANFSKKLQLLILIFFIALATYANRNHINVNLYTHFSIKTYLDLETEITTNTFNEYLPIQANSKLLGKPWNEVIGENLIAYNTKQATDLLSFDINATYEATISAGQFYFPGQTVYLDNKVSQIGIDKQGRISMIVPQGMHTLIIKYQETPLIKLSKILTIIGVLIVIFLLVESKTYSTGLVKYARKVILPVKSSTSKA